MEERKQSPMKQGSKNSQRSSSSQQQDSGSKQSLSKPKIQVKVPSINMARENLQQRIQEYNEKIVEAMYEDKKPVQYPGVVMRVTSLKTDPSVAFQTLENTLTMQISSTSRDIPIPDQLESPEIRAKRSKSGMKSVIESSNSEVSKNGQSSGQKLEIIDIKKSPTLQDDGNQSNNRLQVQYFENSEDNLKVYDQDATQQQTSSVAVNLVITEKIITEENQADQSDSQPVSSLAAEADAAVEIEGLKKANEVARMQDEQSPHQPLDEIEKRVPRILQSSSTMKSNRSLHTRELQASKSILASNDNADLRLVGDLGIKEELKVQSRNQQSKQRESMTYANEGEETKRKKRAAQMELTDQQSINLTEFQSLKAPSDFSKPHEVNNHRDGGGNTEQEEMLLSNNDELLLGQSQSSMSFNTAGNKDISKFQDNKIGTSQITSTKQLNQRRLTTDQKAKKRGKSDLMSKTPSVSQGVSQAAQAFSGKKQQRAVKPMTFGKSPVVQKLAQPFTSQLQKPEPSPRGKGQRIFASTMKGESGFGHTLNLAGRTSVSNKLFKQPAGQTATNFAGTGISGRGLLGKGQDESLKKSVNTIYNKFRPAKIRKSNRNMFYDSLSPNKSGQAENGAESKLLESGLVKMTPLSVLTSQVAAAQNQDTGNSAETDPDQGKQESKSRTQKGFGGSSYRNLSSKKSQKSKDGGKSSRGQSHTPTRRRLLSKMNVDGNTVKNPSTAYLFSDKNLNTEYQSRRQQNSRQALEIHHTETINLTQPQHKELVQKQKVHLQVQTPPTEYNVAAIIDTSENTIKMRELASELHHIDTLRESKAKRSSNSHRDLLDGANKNDSLKDNSIKHQDTQLLIDAEALMRSDQNFTANLDSKLRKGGGTLSQQIRQTHRVISSLANYNDNNNEEKKDDLVLLIVDPKTNDDPSIVPELRETIKQVTTDETAHRDTIPDGTADFGKNFPLFTKIDDDSRQSANQVKQYQSTASHHTFNKMVFEEDGRQRLLTSVTRQDKQSSAYEKQQQQSMVESSIVNIELARQSSNMNQAEQSVQHIYAEKVLQTTSSDPGTTNLVNQSQPDPILLVSNLLKQESTEQSQKTTKIAAFAEAEDTGKTPPQMEMLISNELGGVTLERSATEVTPVPLQEGNFGSLVKPLENQKDQNYSERDNIPVVTENEQSSEYQTYGHKESAGKHSQPNTTNDIANLIRSQASQRQPKIIDQPTPIAKQDPLQMTDRPMQLSKTVTDETSVAGTNQMQPYLMSNRYSNRESIMPNSKGIPDSENQSCSFGAGQLALTESNKRNIQSIEQLQNQPYGSKHLQQQSTSTLNAASTEKVKAALQGTAQFNKLKKQQSSSKERNSDAIVPGTNSKLNKELNKTSSTVSLFKKGRGSKQHSSIMPSPNRQSTSPVKQFQFKLGQVAVDGATTTEDEIGQMTPEIRSVTRTDKNHNQKTMLDTSINVQDQQQQMTMVHHPFQKKTEYEVQAQKLSLNVKLKQTVNWQSQDSMKEYYVQDGVKQFDQMPPPSSGYLSSSRLPDADLTSNNRREGDTLSSPKLTEVTDQGVTRTHGPDQFHTELYSKEDKFAELLGMTDPAALEHRLKCIMDKKNKVPVTDTSEAGALSKSGEALGSIQMTTDYVSKGARQMSMEPYHPQPNRKNNQPPNVFDHHQFNKDIRSPPYGQQSFPPVTHAAAHSLMPVPKENKSGFCGTHARTKPHTAGGTTVFQKSSALLDGMKKQLPSGRRGVKKTTVLTKNPFSLHGSALQKPSTAATETLSGRINQMARTQPIAGLNQTSYSDNNFIASTVGELQRQIKSGKVSMKTLPIHNSTAESDPMMDIIGKNPLKKFKNEIVQINLLKQMKTIMDPSVQSASLYKAGCSFIKLLFGEHYKPNETEVSQIVHFVCSNPTIPLEDLIRVSNTVSDVQKEHLQDAVQEKQAISAKQKQNQLKRVGFGRTISENNGKQKGSQLAKDKNWASTGNFSLGGEMVETVTPRLGGGPLDANSPAGYQTNGDKEMTDEQKAREKQSLKLNAISRRMVLSYKKKKEDLKHYQTKILTRQIEELRGTLAPKIFDSRGSKSQATLTPNRSSHNISSKCSTYDNVSPIRSGSPFDYGASGAGTYITQMAQVDMEMKRKQAELEPLATTTNLEKSLKVHSQSVLGQNSKSALPAATIKPHPKLATLETASKLSQLMTADDKGLRTYLEAKRHSSIAAKLSDLNSKKKKRKQPQIVSRMVPTEKTKLTEMLHQYIQAHKLKSASDGKQNATSSGNGAFSLVTGQSEAIKTEYSAVTMHPREKVNQLLKYRDELRKLARDSNRISADKAQMAAIGISQTGNGQDMLGMLEGRQDFVDTYGVSTGGVYEERRKKVMSQFRTIEKIKQMETGSRNITTKKEQVGSQSQKLLQNLEVKTDLNKIMMNSDFALLPPSGAETIPQQSYSSTQQFAPPDNQNNFTTSFPPLETINLETGGDEQDADELEVQALAKEQTLKKERQQEALNQHYGKIERDMNLEPIMIYKKNNLLLEKIILDRALTKVQKRRFISANVPQK